MGMFFLSCYLFGQDTSTAQFSFYKVNLVQAVNPEDVSDHDFGRDVAEKYAIFLHNYTYIEKATLTSPGDKTIIKKPVIFNSVKKMDKYYRKQVKKGLMELSVGHDKLLKYLTIANMVCSQDTKEFEKALKQAKEPEDLATVFDRATFK